MPDQREAATDQQLVARPVVLGAAGTEDGPRRPSVSPQLLRLINEPVVQLCTNVVRNVGMKHFGQANPKHVVSCSHVGDLTVCGDGAGVIAADSGASGIVRPESGQSILDVLGALLQADRCGRLGALEERCQRWCLGWCGATPGCDPH
ncbi:hypothetical protein [Micromonospora ureilytica]|uniref:hypothetical protein n=1 Tax=Micromonospora ureilytica TaxID=709868 RepID=UPI004039A79E